jgi:hypothetical protein
MFASSNQLAALWVGLRALGSGRGGRKREPRRIRCGGAAIGEAVRTAVEALERRQMLTVFSPTVSGPTELTENTPADYQLTATDDSGNPTIWYQILPNDTLGGWVQVPCNGTGTWPYKAGDEGPDTLQFAVTDNAGSSGSGSDSQTQYTLSNQLNITIDDGQVTFQPAQSPVTATEGDGTTALYLGVVLDTDPLAQPDSDYDTQVTWSDGVQSSNPTFVGTTTDAYGNPVPSGTSAFKVYATRPFAEEGTVTANVAINDDGGNGDTGSISVNVADAPLTAQAVSIGATSGVTFSGTVSTFKDTDSGEPYPSGGDAIYKATIDWGDGPNGADGTDVTSGTIVPDGKGGWLVNGSHTYLDAGSYTMLVTMAETGAQPATKPVTTQPVATVLNPTIFVNGAATTQITLYESQSQPVVVSVLDPTNNNAPLNGWIVLRTDNHQNLVTDNLAGAGAPPTGQNGQRPGETTVTLSAGRPTSKQNPVSVSFTAKSPNFRQPNNPNTATVNVAIKIVNWKVTCDRTVNNNMTLSTKNGAGGDTATATVQALDADTGKPVIGVVLTVTDAVTGDGAQYLTVDAPTTRTTDPNTGKVQFTITTKAQVIPNPGLLSGLSFTWTFADATGTDLMNNTAGWDQSQDLNGSVGN